MSSAEDLAEPSPILRCPSHLASRQTSEMGLEGSKEADAQMKRDGFRPPLLICVYIVNAN